MEAKARNISLLKRKLDFNFPNDLNQAKKKKKSMRIVLNHRLNVENINNSKLKKQVQINNSHREIRIRQIKAEPNYTQKYWCGPRSQMSPKHRKFEENKKRKLKLALTEQSEDQSLTYAGILGRSERAITKRIKQRIDFFKRKNELVESIMMFLKGKQNSLVQEIFSDFEQQTKSI